MFNHAKKDFKAHGIEIEGNLSMNVEKMQKLKGKKLEKYIENTQQKSGPTMMFATLNYPGCCENKETEKISTRWASMLRSSGMDIQTYVIEKDQVLFSSQAGLHAHEIKEYVLQQPECVAVEWNSKRTPGPAETPEWKAKDALIKAEKAKAKEAKDKAEAKAKQRKRRRKTKATTMQSLPRRPRRHPHRQRLRRRHCRSCRRSSSG